MQNSKLNSQQLSEFIVNELKGLKAKDIVVLDVTKMTDMTDYMIIATGTSSKHLKSVASNLLQKAKESNLIPLGVEGAEDSDWVLADLGSAIVHIMLAEARDFYQLEKLWTESADKN